MTQFFFFFGSVAGPAAKLSTVRLLIALGALSVDNHGGIEIWF